MSKYPEFLADFRSERKFQKKCTEERIVQERVKLFFKKILSLEKMFFGI
jgi:hypothetical protein